MSKILLIGRDDKFNEVFRKTFTKQEELDIYVYKYISNEYPTATRISLTFCYTTEYLKMMLGKKRKHNNKIKDIKSVIRRTYGELKRTGSAIQQTSGEEKRED